ncbi:hypothetical protein K2173_024987 [Erythroxylum novogranatense]|uniref:Cystatin domain-containing protein n=1 Tax=Erythroxylum novogranatense TaxID=1862640 RepID=A0AAV8UGD0_9ROSI|nr:hypothetical protein K2173_024987 [Erythroxylum novogranatense]
MFGERFGVNKEHALQNETEEMVEGPRDEAVIEQPQAKKPTIDEKGGGIDSTDELKKENMSDSYSEGGGVYGEVMKEEDECEMDEDEDEDDDEEEEEEDECEMDEDEDEDDDDEEEEEEEEEECEMDEGRHVDTPELSAFLLRMMEIRPVEFKDEEILCRALDTPLYKNCVDGFDVTHSDRNALGLLYSFELPFEDSEAEEWIVSTAEVAINKYNEDHQTHWKYKETIEANYNRLFYGSVYFITYKATHEDEDIKTFEAKVFKDTLGHNNYEDRVEFVRIKSWI